jgi:glycosyltransferase involved in cell wall biosynthesis
MKLIYFYRATGNPNSGVARKINSQVKHLSDCGLDAVIYSTNGNSNQSILDPGDPEGPPPSGQGNQGIASNRIVQMQISEQCPNIISKIRREYLISAALLNIITSLKEKDILYLRIPYPSIFFSWMLRKPRTCKIVIEYQTIEPLERRLIGKYGYLLCDRLFGNALRKNVDAIVGVTDEITQYEVSRSGDPEKPHITIGNGFDVASVPPRQPPAYTGDDLHLLCVANVSRWHGLDRLIQGLATYNGTSRVVFHIAGDGSELPHLRKLAGDLGISDQVIFHGFTTGKALDALFDQCHIAVGSLGIHRKGLTQTSELKGREYCARGIPYIIACGDPDFPADFPYVLQLPADESPIDIERVLAFAKKVCANPDHPQKMRRYAEEHLDWSVKMKKLKGFLEALVGENGSGNVQKTGVSPPVPKN